MGYSISAATYDKLERNRAEGRLCRGTSRNCTTKARWRVTAENWMYRIGDGKHTVDSNIVLCNVHARGVQPGYEGTNFRVLAIDRY